MQGTRWDILAWNKPTIALSGNFAQLSLDDRNILLWMLTDPAAARQTFDRTWRLKRGEWSLLFRAAHDVWPAGAAFSSLVSRLHVERLVFDDWWAAHGIGAPVSVLKLALSTQL